jgi:N-acetylglucosamine-6-phosphate deacetylase
VQVSEGLCNLAGCIATPYGFVEGVIVHKAGRVVSVTGTPLDEAEARSGARPIVVPGFVDLHVHGGGGADVMDGGDAIRKISRLHARHGTTSFLATTLTSPIADLQRAFADLAIHAPVNSPSTAGARVLGVHLEGPYINENKLGAQPPYTRAFDLSEVESLHARYPIRLITLAPEIDGGLAAIDKLAQAGFTVQIGHTAATYELTKAALNSGARGFTHLFNAMSGLHHRAPGAVGAAMAHSEYAEIIPDMQHVHPGAIRAALRSIRCLYCVTDSTAAAGMPDGQYQLGRQTVSKCMGGVRLADGTLAGSSLTMDVAFRNLVQTMGLTLLDATHRVATYAADFLGLSDRGRIAKGACADFVVLDRDLNVVDVWVEGHKQDIV